MKNKYLQLLHILIISLFLCTTAVAANKQRIQSDDDSERLISESIDYDFGYTRQPDKSTSETNPVIGSNGTFNVSQTGAATYSYPIAVPQGINGLQPALSVGYNSQGGNGLIGWGCNISGLSVITRGVKTVFHDGAVGGITHTDNDAYYLDGTRLVLISGAAGCSGAVYSPEHSPAVKVTFHGTGGSVWIDVKTGNGQTYTYGNTADSRQTYTNKLGHNRINAWYINKVEDINGNYMTYHYMADNGMVYPDEILYGNNVNRDTGLHSFVKFAYRQRSDIQEFFIEDVKASLALCIKSIESGAGNDVYRHYDFAYTSDNLPGMPYLRLRSITEQTGSGENRPPVKFEWNGLPLFSQKTLTPDINLKKSSTDYYGAGTIKTDIENEIFLACDMTGDGLADIVEIATSTVTETFPGTVTKRLDTPLYVYKASKDNGVLSYNLAVKYSLGASGNILGMDFNKLTSYQLDFDGDGLADICVPENVEISGHSGRYIKFSLVRGKEVSSGSSMYKYFYHELKGSNKNPLFVSADVDGNGRSEIIVLEKSLYNGTYVCEILGHKDEDGISRYEFRMRLPGAPENIYAGDFNNDGLHDIIVLYSGGYKIYFNRGGLLEGGSIFSENSINAGNTIGHVSRMFQGDFNGDGLSDFLMNNKNNRNWYFAFGCGDGSFNKILACSSELYKHDNGKDDDKMQCLVFDFDNDGKDDVVMTNYVDERQPARTHWMRSTGSSLITVKQALSFNADDALASRFAVGCFTGSGRAELMNYGYDCYGGGSNGTDPQIHIYHNDRYTSSSGKVTSITDETGHTVDITYASLAGDGIYSRGTGGDYPVADCTLPLHVVKNVKTDNGAVGNADATYYYTGLKLHVAGRGLLGMSAVRVTDNITGNKTETGTEAWDADCFVPQKTFIRKTAGSYIETARTTNTYKKYGNKTFALQETVTETVDPDMFYSTVTKKYDPQTGSLVYEREEGDCTDDYHEVAYSNFVDISGMRLPQTVTYADCHIDDDPVERQTHITYNEKGQKITECVNSESSLPLITEYSYDIFGNITSSSTSGNGVERLEKRRVYDISGRFVIKEYTVPASSVTGYTHDIWGNVLTETDMTNPASSLVTTYTYDTWGNESFVTSPTGARAGIMRGWNSDTSKRYYVLRQAEGEPWVKTWYDSMGREVLKESVGMKDIDVRTETEYDKYGNVSKVTSQTGDISVTKTMQYDRRGRIISEKRSDAGTITYTYSDRDVTINDNGREYTKEYGDWGFTRSATDPSGEVYYIYNSFFKPVEVDVLSGNLIVTLEYDDLGNRTAINDPDAGRTSYTHDALGRVRTQTDARGNKSSYTFDVLGRQTVISGNDAVFAEYTYGDTGNEAQKLIKEKRGDLYTVYSYDAYGRVSLKTRHVGTEILTYNYIYNSLGQVTRIVYPGGVTADYTYDCYGNNTAIAVGGKTVWSIGNNTGKSFSANLGTALMENIQSDESGRTLSRTLKRNNKYDDNIFRTTYSYDNTTSNLVSKKVEADFIQAYPNDSLKIDTAIVVGPIKDLDGLGYKSVSLTRDSLLYPGQRPDWESELIFQGWTETYSYDSSDRLTRVNRNNKIFQNMEYDANGNILSKTNVGTYSYHNEKVHALTGIDVADNKYAPGGQEVVYNFFGKAETLSEWSGDEFRELDLIYGPDMERWKSVLNIDGEEKRTIIYSDDYECVRENDVIRQFYYLGGNVVYVRQTGKEDMICYATTDNQGSIMCIVDEAGKKVFEATYDAWGKQYVIRNNIGFIRGYTDHEMLPEFELINMNGRIYDPVVARFLSPDNYVQMPENTQNFNRYSYCLNNPLKYTDPSGEWFGIDDLFIAGISFAAGYISNSLSTGHWGWESIKAGTISAVSSWIGFNTAGMATGAITTNTLEQGMNIGLNTVLSSFLPPITIPFSSHLGLSFSPLCGFGTGGLSFGAGLSIGYTNGDISIQAGMGMGNYYSGWNVGASYKGFGGGFGITSYKKGTFQGLNIDAQKVASIGVRVGNVSFNISNDLWGDHEDRWRTSAAELSIGKFSIGTYVDTNWGKEESFDPKVIKGKDKFLGTGDTWNNGKVYSAPIWVGYRLNNMSYKLGISHPYVQSLTQNFVHKYITPTPYFLDYSLFTQGLFSYSGNLNPFTLWNY
ncbi:hypothetical protein HPS54_08270 [Prevotella sp. PCHR]|uniref:RHS repeat-associated protein n=2 Tax=Xylanibacter caecicola TaxID=2736294 RepID=A0ABX2B698_9BACT|nr:polymorphic toxin type 23 domain-containing protein [Xylanibacter caecicola]NPE25505.1 hypothetical protein [Xylanibacter caecicola]